jgi:hypothetical protein
MKRLTYRRWIRRTLTIATAGLVLSACDEDLKTPTGFDQTELDVSLLAPGVHAVITMPDLRLEGGPTEARLHLIPVGIESGIGSFQGELEWDPERVRVIPGDSPGGIMVAWNLVRPGLIRFAGASVTGVGLEPILEFTVDAQQEVSAEMFSIRVEELVGSSEFTNVLPQFVRRPHPALVESLVGVLR